MNQQNMHIPLHAITSEMKVGQSGPVNWFINAKCHKQVVQFSQSIWNQNKFELKQKIQYQLVQQRNILHLERDANRMQLATVPIYIGMLIALIVYVITLSNAVDDDDYDIMYYVYLYIFVIFGLMFCAFGIICYFVSNMRKKVQTSIMFLNQKLSQEGLNVTVVSKKKCPFPSVLNFTHFQVYQRVYH